MSDKPISVGDLVAVVKPTLCCGDGSYLGWHFIVQMIDDGGFGRCTFCHHAAASEDALMPDGLWVDLVRLKRIPPLDELEGEKRDEKLTEPA